MIKMKKYQVEIYSIEATYKLAHALGELLFPGAVLCLEGDLGAGKTTFTKGLGASLGVKSVINSPTFTIIKEYDGKLPLYHMDVYRIENEHEDLGFDEYFYGNGVTVIEWARRIMSQLPEERLDIYIYAEGNKRLFEFYPHGEKYEEICEVLKREKFFD